MSTPSSTPSRAAELLAEARESIHAAVAESGDRRRMFAHHASTLAADAALCADVEASQRGRALSYIEESVGLLARAAEELSAASPTEALRVVGEPHPPPLPSARGGVGVVRSR